MERSAPQPAQPFHALAQQSWQRPADIALRETVGRLGREGEAQMMLATVGHTHRGAIWALGPAGQRGGDVEWRGSVTGDRRRRRRPRPPARRLRAEKL